jgi:CheY-like chemotaxis protein
MKSRCILIVDDDPLIRELMTELLRDEGYQVETAADGAQGLELVERLTPALAVVDAEMPGLDGEGFVRALRRRHQRLPVVAISVDRWSARSMVERGASAYLTKPFQLDDVVGTVARFCQDRTAA